MYGTLLFVFSMFLIGGGAVAAMPAMIQEGKPAWTVLVPAAVVLMSGITLVLFAIHCLIG